LLEVLAGGKVVATVDAAVAVVVAVAEMAAEMAGGLDVEKTVAEDNPRKNAPDLC
jgi:hypothetical protein